MGKTAFNGPVYGAKGGLFSFGPLNPTANSTASLLATVVVPPYETWYLTELFASNVAATSNSSTPRVVLKVDGTGAGDPAFPAGNPGTAANLVGPTSTAGFNQVQTATVSPAGEFEGYAAPANSTIRVLSSGTMGALQVRVNGFIRYFDSTRVAQ
jgi:hypothetical protein